MQTVNSSLFSIRMHPEELTRGIRFQEEAYAERLCNVIRAVYVAFWLITTYVSRCFQPPAANWANLGLGSAWFVIALGHHFILRRKPYHPAFKYVSTSLDILIVTLILYFYQFGMGYSTTLKSLPFVTYFFILVITALRFNIALSIYGGLFTILAYSAMAGLTLAQNGMPFGTVIEEFTTPRVSLLHQVYRLVYLLTLTVLLIILVRHTTRLVNEKVERRKTQDLFERYFTPDIAGYLAGHPPALGGSSQTVTVMFTDLRNFTSRSERLGPTRSVALLNRLFEEMVAIVFRHGGTLDKYLGDGMLVVFGVPFPKPDDATRAVKAAMEIVRTVRETGEEEGLEVGIALHTGEVIFGNIGSSQRMELTVIGDTVNTAARMEALNKEFGTSILISGSTWQAVSGRFNARELPARPLRGKSEMVALYEVLGTSA